MGGSFFAGQFLAARGMILLRCLPGSKDSALFSCVVVAQCLAVAFIGSGRRSR